VSVHQKEFEETKNALCTAPALAFPNMRKPFELHTDACTTGISFILSQSDDDGDEHPICFGGRGLHQSEQNRTVTEQEALAIVEGARAYHPYLIAQLLPIMYH